ncbi:MAG: anti-sigma factor [Gemmatimonadaceae bacterium]
MTHETYLESAAAYALGALDERDRGAFEAHLAECAECRSAVAEYRNVAGLLAYAVPNGRPADGEALRRRVIQEAANVRPLTSAASRRPAMGQRRSSIPWLAAAACLLVAGLSGVAWRRARSDAELLGLDLAAARAGLASRDSTIAAFFGPEVHVVSLSEAEQKPKMRVYWNHTRNLFIVTAFNVPRAPEGKTYQLWAMVKGKAPISMGTFKTDSSGRATALLQVASSVIDAGHIDDCALTMEPEGGSAQPTESPRLIGSWRHVD